MIKFPIPYRISILELGYFEAFLEEVRFMNNFRRTEKVL